MAGAQRILVIDDDPDVGIFCSAVLGKAGYAVECAAGAQEGLAAVRRAPPDLVILDVMMEEADSGFQAACTLAKEQPKLPILLFSSIARAAGQVFDTSALPVSEVVEKPIQPQDLVKTVGRLLARARG